MTSLCKYDTSNSIIFVVAVLSADCVCMHTHVCGVCVFVGTTMREKDS